MVGEIISERRATSNRNGGRHHRGFAGDFPRNPHTHRGVLDDRTYYRSQASFSVRIALNLKGISREDSFLHLEKGEQFAAEYRAINPQMVVPTLIDGDVKLFQSLCDASPEAVAALLDAVWGGRETLIVVSTDL